ncbi:MAG: threonylcarbamoyl-AMP synthase [Flavobacteriia bacterium]|nr:threonylcarbamoyl-AMP synthase [Flavobacteriia bacterium]
MLTKAFESLKNGEIILYPTDTIWGIGCDATNEEACQKINKLKNRTSGKSFIILVDSFQMLEKYIPDFPNVCYDLVDFSEKPLTIIYPNAKGLAQSIVAEDGSVGIRITKDVICLQLIRAIKKPIVSTSANISNEKHPTNYNDISEVIKSNVDTIVLERTSEVMNTPSQIIKIGLDGTVKIIRS